MCGIAGQIGYEENMRRMSVVMSQMSAAIAPRGPDASGLYVDDDAYLVHRRLAVIDPDNGAQPMSFGGFTLVYNGELYNTAELRRELERRGVEFSGHSDTEVVLRSYVEYGGSVLHNSTVDDETVRAVCRYAASHGERLCLEGVDKLYTIGDVGMIETVDMTRSLEKYLADPAKLKVTKVTFFDPLPADFDARFPVLRRIEFATYAEGIQQGYSKATGMALLCEKLGIPRERTAAFGDSENDIEMLDYAAKSVIMHHAPAALDAHATLRTDGDEDGVAEGIEKLFYGEKA